jgi:hypothetical protein
MADTADLKSAVERRTGSSPVSGTTLKAKNVMNYRDFVDEHDKETWQGTSTAFRNGVKCRVLGLESNYLFRRDFQDAWLRGFNMADQYLSRGGTIDAITNS